MVGAHYAPTTPLNLDELSQWKAGEFWGRTSPDDYVDLTDVEACRYCAFWTSDVDLLADHYMDEHQGALEGRVRRGAWP